MKKYDEVDVLLEGQLKMLGAVGVIVLILGLASMSESDYQDEVDQQAHYCEMVELWNDNKHLPKEQRPGWPPYKGECHED